jgi:Flp pilus assembly protein CpaB
VSTYRDRSDRLRDRLLSNEQRASAPWHGPPPSLPEVADRLAERWYGLPPRVRVVLAVAAALVVLFVAGSGVARSPWGRPVDVIVAAADLPAGSPLDAGMIRPERRPEGLVPADALGADAANGARLAGTVVAGTVLTARHLHDGDGVAAHLAPGRAAFPVEAGTVVAVQAGQRVDVVAGDVEGRGRALATDARVLSVGEGVVWLEIDRADAPALAAAATWDGLRIVLLPPAR